MPLDFPTAVRVVMHSKFWLTKLKCIKCGRHYHRTPSQIKVSAQDFECADVWPGGCNWNGGSKRLKRKAKAASLKRADSSEEINGAADRDTTMPEKSEEGEIVNNKAKGMEKTN